MGDDMKLKQKTRRFFENAKQGLAIWQQATAILDFHLARQFNFFHSIKFNENRMSDVFAYLLNPDEAHGQGELFLREFLADVKDSSDVVVDWWPSDWSRVYVDREVQTTQIKNWKRKIDIEIAFHIDDGWAAIAIENKPRAGDQDQQLSAYARHLESMYEGCFKLIYLTPKGEDPSECSITREEREQLEKEGKFAKASIQKWADGWLKRAEDEVKAEQVRWFVSDFRKALIESLPAQKE